jgi:hypothetical protein
MIVCDWGLARGRGGRRVLPTPSSLRPWRVGRAAERLLYAGLVAVEPLYGGEHAFSCCSCCAPGRAKSPVYTCATCAATFRWWLPSRWRCQSSSTCTLVTPPAGHLWTVAGWEVKFTRAAVGIGSSLFLVGLRGTFSGLSHLLGYQDREIPKGGTWFPSSLRHSPGRRAGDATSWQSPP